MREQAVHGRNFVAWGLAQRLGQGQPRLEPVPVVARELDHAHLGVDTPVCTSGPVRRQWRGELPGGRCRPVASGCGQTSGCRAPGKFQGRLVAGAMLVPGHYVSTRGTLLTTFAS